MKNNSKVNILTLSVLINFSLSLPAVNNIAVVDDRSIPLDSDINSLHNSNHTNNTNKSSLINNLTKKFSELPQSKTEISKELWSDKVAYNDKTTIEAKGYSNNNANQEARIAAESRDKINPNANILIEYKNQTETEDNTADNYRNIARADDYYTNSSNQNVNNQPSYESQYEQPVSSYNESSDTDNRESVLAELEYLPVPSRVKRLENIIETQKSQQLNNKIKFLQDEVQNLRGMLDAERHKIDKSLSQQKLLYEDLDRRFNLAQSTNGAGTDSTEAKKSYTFHDEKIKQQDLYTTAYQSIKARDYPKAIELFNKYLDDYPKGMFGANANYWLGEIYMVQSSYDKALQAFDKVLTGYPSNSKSADAMYKKGLVHIYLKDFSAAKVVLSEVKQKYKNTTAARLADKQLQGIEDINNDT